MKVNNSLQIPADQLSTLLQVWDFLNVMASTLELKPPQDYNEFYLKIQNNSNQIHYYYSQLMMLIFTENQSTHRDIPVLHLFT